MDAAVERVKKVRIIPPKISAADKAIEQIRRVRVAAYCRVSTKEEEQLNSYATQCAWYTEKINANPEWEMVGIFADKGITGTSVLKRDEFNRLMRYCKRGKVDLILTKSISRFARNTLDCLKYIRMLRSLGIDVFFEEQGIHSIKPDAEFYITIYGGIAQSESENISANVKFGKAQSAKEGKVVFNYKYFLGYKKGEDGNPEIDENEAETIRYIYNRFLAGDSLQTICKGLENQKILTPYGKEKWTSGTVQSILTNEKYKGDAVINKTYVVDCISKKVKVNDGDRPKYYVENNHPAIIDPATFGRVQEELAKRSGKKRVKFKGVKTEQGKYSSKYALTEMLICGECKTPYRRCTWTVRGEKKIVWRCVKRLDYGKRYCHSPTIEESALQAAIVNAIQKVAAADGETMQTLKSHIDKVFTENITADNEEEMSLQIRISELDAEIKAMISSVSADTIDDFDEEKAQSLMSEKNELQNKLEEIYGNKTRKEAVQSRLQDVYAIMDGLKNHQIVYSDELIRQIIEVVVVESKEKIKIIFKGGLTVEENL